MNRREALKHIGLATGFVVVTPTLISLLHSCKGKEKWIPVFLNEEEAIMVENIVDVILPKTEQLPSALDLNVPKFIDTFLNEVLEADEQQFAREASNNILGILKTDYNEKLNKVTPEQYKELLNTHMRIKGEIDEERKTNPEAKAMTKSEFLNSLKWLTINAYKCNEEIGENVLAYDPVPAAYHCGDLQELTDGKSWSLPLRFS